MSGLFSALSRALSPCYTEMSIMLMATTLVVYGDLINGHAKRILPPYHLITRVSSFVVLSAMAH